MPALRSQLTIIDRFAPLASRIARLVLAGAVLCALTTPTWAASSDAGTTLLTVSAGEQGSGAPSAPANVTTPDKPALQDQRAASTQAGPGAQPAPTSGTQQATTPGTQATSKPAPKQEDYVREIEQIRKLSFTSPVAQGSQSLAEFRKFVQRDIDTDLPPTRAACVSRALGRLGLLPDSFDLRKAFSDLLVSQVAAYYNPYKRTFYVVHTDLPESFLHPIIIHEMTHALQDQRFGLAARIKALQGAGNEDRENAFRFLAEGEATYVMTIATLRGQGIDPEISKQLVDWTVEITGGLGRRGIARQLETAKELMGKDAAAEMEAVLTYPDYLFRVLFDPYFAGQTAIHHVFRKGGWSAVNELWQNPPQTTEMFMHPEKLEGGRREAPVEVSVPDLATALGPDYRSSCEGTLGELEVEVLLETNLPIRPPGTAAAAGTSSPPPAASSPGSDVPPATAGPTAPAAPAARSATLMTGTLTAAPNTAQPPPSDKVTIAAGTGGSPAPSPTPAPATDDATLAARIAQEQIDLEQKRVDRARAAAAGWGGDRYRAFEGPNGGAIVVWQTAWDTEPDAIEFEAAMRQVAAQRGIRPDGTEMAVLRQGSEVTCIAGASKTQSAAALRAIEMAATARLTPAPAAAAPPAAGPAQVPTSVPPPPPEL